jgi:hypothetical protein
MYTYEIEVKDIDNYQMGYVIHSKILTDDVNNWNEYKYSLFNENYKASWSYGLRYAVDEYDLKEKIENRDKLIDEILKYEET